MKKKSKKRLFILISAFLIFYFLIVWSYSPEQAIRKTVFLNLQFNSAFSADIKKGLGKNHYIVNGYIDKATGNPNDIVLVKHNIFLGYYVSSVATGP